MKYCCANISFCDDVRYLLTYFPATKLTIKTPERRH